MPRIRRIALGLWVILVVALTALYAVNPGLLQPEVLVDVLRQSGQPVLLAYIVLSIVRAFTLIPSTVLIIVGILLFPDRPGVKPIPSWNSPRLLMAYAAFFFDVVVSIFSSRLNASRSLGRCR